MEKLEAAIEAIHNYPKDHIPLSFASDVLKVKRATLRSKVQRKEVESVFDGYKHFIPKNDLKYLALKNRSLILGWIREVDIIRELSTKVPTLNNIYRKNNLEVELDLCGKTRLPPATEIAIREGISEYTSKEEITISGQKYFSVIKLSIEMASKITEKSNIHLFKREQKRIRRCIDEWIIKEKVEFIKAKGKISNYVAFDTYENLKDMIRVKDAAFVVGCSTETIRNWIKKGYIKYTCVAGDFKMISAYDLDGLLIARIQSKMLKKTKNENDASEIGNINSCYWKDATKKVTNASFRFQKVRKNLEKKDRITYIESRTGFKREEIRAIYAIKSRRNKINFNDVELNKTIVSGIGHGNMTVGDVFEDKGSNAYEDLARNDLMSLLNILPKEDKELIDSLFGISDMGGDLTKIAKRRGVPVERLQRKVESLLRGFKEKLS